MMRGYRWPYLCHRILLIRQQSLTSNHETSRESNTADFSESFASLKLLCHHLDFLAASLQLVLHIPTLRAQISKNSKRSWAAVWSGYNPNMGGYYLCHFGHVLQLRSAGRTLQQHCARKVSRLTYLANLPQHCVFFAYNPLYRDLKSPVLENI